MAAAAVRAQDASSSMSRCTYHVFLSFRGEDTRTNFISHLYGALVQAGIHTFLDNDGIERGENIEAELQKAIKESKISIIVFSKDYASSRWCLDELVMIMEQRKAVGLIVVPVFYDVDPSQVRKQMGSFSEAFARHEKRFKEEMDKVERWRAALREVADLGGMVLDNGYEWEFVQNIVKEIENKLNQPVLNVAPYLVGLDSRIKYINLWVQDGSNDVGIAMIYGIGGTGKTTIAKTVYNMNYNRFEGGSFLGNVRETIEQPNGLVCLQEQLLSDLFKGKTSKIYNADKGIIKIKNAISCRRVLLVLDDVDQMNQLNTIVGMQEWFYPGSKIIIITRHKHLPRSHEVCQMFEVKQMDDDESLQLFSWHAFGQGHPIEAYMECSRSVVHHCGGLPLALEVLGSSLSGKSIDVWVSALQKLEAISDGKIQKVLKISYDSLQDDHDKNLFLDIACFFIGEDSDYIIGILDGCNFCTAVGIQNLIDMCLLSVNEDKKLMMHQLLRDMGREIVRQESTENPGKRSRLWHHRDTFTVLKEKTGTKTVKGLTLDFRRLMEDKHGKTLVTVNYAKRQNYENFLDKFTAGNYSERHHLGFCSGQLLSTTSANSFPSSNEAGLETKTFMKMHKLKLLQLNYVKLCGDYGDFPKNLIWLCWHGFPLKSIPINFSLEKLVALDMRYSSLQNVWRGTKFLAELKFLNLSHSHSLVRTPDFSGLPSLMRLIFKDCINLVKVDESIGDLERLVLLNLKDCKNLMKLPREMSRLKSLKELNLSGCSKLDELPEDMRKMESLKVLYLDGTLTNQLLSITIDRRRRSLLSPTFWHSAFQTRLSPKISPHSISFSLAFLPHSIVKLSLANCNLSDDDISYGLASLPSLEHLNLSGNPFYSLQETLKGLTKLEFLELSHCTRLQLLPEFPLSLEGLHVDYCTSLERVPYTPFFTKFEFLEIVNCEKLVEVEAIFKLEPIKNTDMAIIKSLGLSNLESLGNIEVDLDNFILGKERKLPLQVLHECGISSIFLPGSEVPNCFSLKNTGSLISFDVPTFFGNKIRGLNLCTLYGLDPESDVEYHNYYPHYARINNKTTCTKWTYEPIFFAYRGVEEGDMLWLSQWNFRYDEIEGEDEIEVSVVFPPPLQVKMCGICFMYEPEDKGTQSNTEKTVLSAFPWYDTITHTINHTQAGEETKFHCHHSFQSLYKYSCFPDSDNEREKFMDDYINSRQFQKCVICSIFSRGPKKHSHL